MFASSIVGTLLGTYIASVVIKSSKIIDDKTEAIKDIIHDTFEGDSTKTTSDTSTKTASEEAPKEEQKSARERLKDKGLL